MILYDLFLRGGPVMWPLLLLSVLTVACALSRAWFWLRLLSQEDAIVRDVLDAARYDLARAEDIARQARDLPVGRFLHAPLRLSNASPETFHLALEAAADCEFANMREGDRFLETVVAVAPLLGLLGTVTGLIATFDSLNIGSGGSAEDAAQAASGIGEALVTTAAGMIVAIVALLIFRVLVGLQSQQVDFFSDVGSELELIYRQNWYEAGTATRDIALLPAGAAPDDPSARGTAPDAAAPGDPSALPSQE